MTSTNIRQDIRDALAKFDSLDFGTSAKLLLGTLGYNSERVPQGQSGEIDEFITEYPADNPDTNSEREFKEHAESVRLIFQVASEEIAAAASTQQSLFSPTEFEKGRAQSFVFAAAELKDPEYPRGLYARLAREISKRLPMPLVALFRTSTGRLTVAFINRRANKRIADRDVLGDVSIIRQIDTQKPHRAHIDILAELSLDDRLRWMDSNNKPHNFDGLLAAWLNTLDTEALNKRFYDDLFKWFEHAKTQAEFPKKGAKVQDREEHVIRLITRMLFVWFFKEKGLIAEDLFIEGRIANLLRDYDHDNGDSYYRAVLQNLFFATLNTEVARRGFSSRQRRTHRLPTYYRYRAEMSDPDRLLKLFSRTPFINGGLFECLDSEEAIRDGGWRIDCFTDTLAQRRDYSIPNRLFFGENGLIDLFDRYKFTVEENTPVEQEVALDPELLGKVFENLLAAINPETRETVRKQTGSYYTPRIVVDYMADEALVAYLSGRLSPADGDRDFLLDRLNYLLNYSADFDDADDLFTESEREIIVRAIAEIKILDPAVGSGAFPMAMLQKLTLALSRLDKRNELWEEIQKDMASRRASAAFNIDDQDERSDELEEISETFEKYRESDFGRKLYLIQNGIYGVDIQPVATQITKLRFFISLAIEQQIEADAKNLGIKQLPNLETRFVAADTLLELHDLQGVLTSKSIIELQMKLRQNRERHFHARIRDQKLACIERDEELRLELAAELLEVGLDSTESERIAAWDPYDQIERADWFDAEYMFGVTDGFDVVIGNPPYIRLQKDAGRLRRLYENVGFETFESTGDVYQLFFERALTLAESETGLLAYITSNSWLKSEYGKSTRRFFAKKHTPLKLIEMGKDVFESAIVDSSVLLMRRGKVEGGSSIVSAVDMDRIADGEFPPDIDLWEQVRPEGDAPWKILSNIEQEIMDKMEIKGVPLKSWDVNINSGVKTGCNDAFVIDTETRDSLIAADPRSSDLIRKVLGGQDIQRYSTKWSEKWLIDTHNGYGNIPPIDIDNYPAVKSYLRAFYPALETRGDKGVTPYNLRNCAYHESFYEPKLLWIELVEKGRFAYDTTGTFCLNSAYILNGASLKYLCAVLNSTLITWFMNNSALNSGMGTTRWVKFTIERLPIPEIPDAEQKPFIDLVNDILTAKAANPDADTGTEESEIDRLVYELYGLTDDEIAVIEGASN